MATAADRPIRCGTTGLAGRAAAVVEVLSAFALVHVSFRAFKHFTTLGRLEVASRLNFSAGATMLLFTAASILLCRRRFVDYGLTLKDWRTHLNVGLFWTLVLIAAVALVVALRTIRIDPLHGPDLTKAAVSSLAHCAAAAVGADPPRRSMRDRSLIVRRMLEEGGGR